MKNIVICCDGTGNEISENISNVLKLYRMLRKTGKTEPHQLVFYDPGVGTLARPDPWRKVWQDTITILGLATGYGLDDNVLAAYDFLVRNYEDGDDIFLFGFSRGAYTVRVLAGLVHKVGLVSPQQSNLSGAGLTAYKQFSSDAEQGGLGLNSSQLVDGGNEAEQGGPVTRDDQAAQFARILSARWPTIKFVGVWDTVASVIVPRPDRLYLPSLLQLAYTQQNPSVKIFRQAIAIDERRRMFRLQPWEQPQTFMRNRFSKTNNEEPQDILQVWFAGVHADIGGGYPEKESGLSKFPAAVDDRRSREMWVLLLIRRRSTSWRGASNGKEAHSLTWLPTSSAIRTIRCQPPGGSSNTCRNRTNTRSGRRASRTLGTTYRMPSRAPLRKVPLSTNR